MLELTLIQKIAIWALPLLFAITLHEVAHGFAAYLCDDKTAKFSGRLTINPLKHIDPFGTIFVPILLLSLSNFVMGWAKPVPVNAQNVSRPRLQMPLIALAGPVANFLMAFFWAGIAKCGYLLVGGNSWLGTPLIYMGEAGISINVVLCILNCLPIPPLDGWHALTYSVSGKISRYLERYERYGFFIILFLIISGALSYVIAPPIYGMTSWINSLFRIG